MSIKLNIRLGGREIPKAAFTQMLTSSLRKHFDVEVAVVWQADDADHTSLGNRPTSFAVIVDEAAEVECLVFSADTQEEIDDDCQWWVTVTVAVRTPASFTLMLLTAVCLAQLAGAAIVDDALLLKSGREWQAAELEKVVKNNFRLSLAESAAPIKAALNAGEQ